MGCSESRASEHDPKEHANLPNLMQPGQSSVKHPSVTLQPEPDAKRARLPSFSIPSTLQPSVDQPQVVEPDSAKGGAQAREYLMTPSARNSEATPGRSLNRRTDTYDLTWFEVNVPASTHEKPEEYPMTPSNSNAAPGRASQKVKRRTDTYDLTWVEVNVPASTHEEPEEYPMTPSVRNCNAAPGRASQKLKGRMGTYDLSWLEVHAPASDL